MNYYYETGEIADKEIYVKGLTIEGKGGQ